MEGERDDQDGRDLEQGVMSLTRPLEEELVKITHATLSLSSSFFRPFSELKKKAMEMFFVFNRTFHQCLEIGLKTGTCIFTTSLKKYLFT